MLSERADQSTWPTLGEDEDGRRSCGRGPHNIVRTCCEFALEEYGTCEVYVGSPAEIAATARARVTPSIDSSELLFMDDLSALPVLERLRAAADARELLSVCKDLGLEMSERTAHRVVSGQIKPLRSVASRMLRKADAPTGPKSVDLYRDRRGLKLSKPDMEEFSHVLAKDFSFIEDRYYVSLVNDPKVRVGKGRITVTFDLEDAD